MKRAKRTPVDAAKAVDAVRVVAAARAVEPRGGGDTGTLPETAPRLPRPRGPVSGSLFERLARAPHDLGPIAVPSGGPALYDEDLQVALYACYELHYQGFDGVDERWEWHPSLLRARELLERRFEQGLSAAVRRPPPVPARELPRALADLAAEDDDGPTLADHLRHHAGPAQFREFVVHRSIYHLKEADPHTWGIPRLRGPAKAALVEIQADEYGGGRCERMHAELFRATMRGLGLSDAYGAYVDRVPAITLAVNNAMSLFGLHRRHRGALLGHLAALEMTSSLPNAKYGRGLRRLGADAMTARFYDEHVQADAVHEQIAGHDMCGAFAAAHPSLAGDVLYGAACCLALDRLFALHLLGRWEAGASSLRDGGPA
ncbi:iron-containing redox enzyme family protein [Sphaerisporangium perillae]|uniref:iron-containing redox enzyme family protein n=1 Tax=Sphaerisporangium perillae TaxID=2935860 RepID=UPI00200F096B|nr:iron-containing redox enzyme family protein [Sphaerisporangium perillae]